MTDRLWQAAIGNAQDKHAGAEAPCRHAAMLMPMGVGGLLGTGRQSPALPPVADLLPVTPESVSPAIRVDAPAGPVVDRSVGSLTRLGSETGIGALSTLGPNAGHAATLQAAAERSGLPASTLAAIVDAEAAKRPDGSWNLRSRNPRSSAAGLGQFLSGTWIGMAQTAGTWLHDVARQKGWIDQNGRVASSARGSLLALRYDATASINSIADYARSNIATIRKAGIRTGDNPDALAKIAYLGHHLGPGDAIRYLKGGLADGRASRLLKAQIGAAPALERIARIGDASAAHRDWLDTYIARKIRPDRFAGASLPNSS
ncbi:peptidoglycan-binding protein [Pseudoblastomonas halimionae]|nr:peptidoglycan-binding protein [Alteriqipengyuania halimionae]